MMFAPIYLCLFSYVLIAVIATPVSSNATSEVKNESHEDYTSWEEDSPEQVVLNASLSIELKFFTPCETPEGLPGLCTEIRKCGALLTLLEKDKAKDFLRSSRCGPENEDQYNPKVCCPKYKQKSTTSTTIPNLTKLLPKKCGRQKIITRARIMGGTPAAVGEFPWMARLFKRTLNGYKFFGCGGFLIHSRFVLTAAHCVEKRRDQKEILYSVTLGDHNTTTEIYCYRNECTATQERRVGKVISHPEYDPHDNGHYNDIALVYLKKHVTMTDNIKPICLLEDPETVVKKYSVSGWGTTETDMESTVKMKAYLLSVPQETCEQKWSTFNIKVKETQLCAGGHAHNDTCRGDSGGPLMMFHGDVWFAAGIVSFGIGCGMPGWPGVYTNIPSYVPWIRTTMSEILAAETRKKLLRKAKRPNKQ